MFHLHKYKSEIEHLILINVGVTFRFDDAALTRIRHWKGNGFQDKPGNPKKFHHTQTSTFIEAKTDSISDQLLTLFDTTWIS